MKLRNISTAVLVGTLVLSIAAPAHGAADGTRYYTHLVGRGVNAAADGCKVAPGAVDTMREAWFADMLGIGEAFGANLIPTRVGTSGRLCVGNMLYLSLGDANYLRDRYGWSHYTSGYSGTAMASLATYEEKRQEACGSLDWMNSHAFPGASVFFAAKYPAGGTNVTDADRQIIRDCGFSPWVRDYGDNTYYYGPIVNGQRVPTNVYGNLDPDGAYRVLSINGGGCDPAKVKCGPGGTGTYMPRETLLRYIKDAPPNSHTVFQQYALVEGNGPDHNCADDGIPNWTDELENYCREDLWAVFRAVAASNMQPASMQTVAKAWGLI